MANTESFLQGCPEYSGRLFLCIRTYLLLASVLVLAVGVSCSRSDTTVGERGVSLLSEDGVSLGLTLYTPRKSAEKPVGLILVHRYGADRKVWEGFARLARETGMLVATVDLRGHGDSVTRNGRAVHYSQLSDGEIGESLKDIDAAKKCLLEAGADPESLAVAGEGLGANLGLRYALGSRDIQAVVMLSPGLEYNGIAAEDAIRGLDDCPTLLVSGEGDAYAAMSAAALKAAAPVFSELCTWPGAAHGTDLFASHPESMQYILQWLQKIFNRA